MKTVLMILVLLAVAEWKKKEACRTKGRGWAKIKSVQGSTTFEHDFLGRHEDTTADMDDGNNFPVHYDNFPLRDILNGYTSHDPDQSGNQNQDHLQPYNIGNQDQSDVPMPTLVPNFPTCHLLIVGAGAQTVALLNNLAIRTWMKLNKRMMPYTRFHIVIVEQKSKLGPGSPYDSDEVIPEHLTNNFRFDDISIVESERYTDFFNWAWANPRLLQPDKLGYDRKGNLILPPPRSEVGQYLEQRFNELVNECKGMFWITLIDNTSADRVSREDSGFVVELSDGSKVHTTDIVLATGHWNINLFGKDTPKGFFPSPWPASALTHPRTGIPADAKVGILGNGQNAIDAIMTLAHKHGTFTPPRQKQYGFDYTPNSEHFHITLYSRWGHLPAVRGKTYEYKFHVMDQYDNERFANEIQSLNDLMRLLRRDLAMFRLDVNLDQYRSAKQFIEDIDNKLYASARNDPRERLEKGINDTIKSLLNENEVLDFQSFFTGMVRYFNKYLARFPPKDIFTFETEIAPRILNYARPIPLVTAQKLHALMDADRLNIVDAGDKIEVVKGQNNQGVRVKYQNGRDESKIPHDYFIDATEQSGDVKNNPSPLVQSLFQNKFIQPNYLDLHPLPNDKRIEKVVLKYKDETTNKIQKIEKKLYRSDGVKMDIATMRVIPPDDAPPELLQGADAASVIYATGPFMYGQYAFGESLPHVVQLADRMASDIVMTRFKIYNKRHLDSEEDF